MPWLFSTDRPIYSQLIEQISINIVNGFYPAGSRLPSVRDLANQAKVNPNTMQRALAELENIGLVYTERTTGRFVTEDSNMITATKQNLANEQIRQFFSAMANLGITEALALELAAAHKGDEFNGKQ